MNDRSVDLHCVHCRGTRHIIADDGPPVCVMCIDLLGSIAADPSRTDERILVALCKAHGDVVELLGGPLHWHWTAPWPVAA